MRHLFLLLMALMTLVGCAALEPADCRKADLVTYADTVEKQIATFEQQAQLVAASPRMSIGVPLQRLLDIQTETRDVVAPGCLTAFHDQVTEAMATQQRGFQAFAAQQGTDAEAAAMIQLGKLQLTTVASELVSIQEGTLPPAPEPVTPPEPGVVQESTLVRLAPGPDAKGAMAVCPSDRFEIIGRRTIEDASWVQIRVTAAGPNDSCIRVFGPPPIGVEGWLLDSEVFAQ